MEEILKRLAQEGAIEETRELAQTIWLPSSAASPAVTKSANAGSDLPLGSEQW
jgi:hypothetical protein